MSRFTHFSKIILWLMLLGSAGVTLISASAYLYLSPNLPSVDVLRDVQLQTPLRVYTADEKLLGEFGEKRRSPIRYEQIPEPFIKAILAAEDNRFFEHHGVDVKGLLRAVSQLLITGEKQGGGSTITMQVARNYFLSFERTFSRKFNEILLSFQIEKELSKQEIMELYVNKIFLGNRAYGIEAAAQVYYGQSINELNLAQLAMIAGLPKAPSSYNPLVNPARAILRRNWILGRMAELDYIDQASYQQAVDSPITASYHGSQVALYAPYIAEMVRKEMLQRYGKESYTAGYKVYTTVSSPLQLAADQAVRNGLLAYDQRHGYRGPEASITLENTAAASPEELYKLWQDTLSNTRQHDDFAPAIVTTVHENAFNALLRDGTEVLIDWDQGLNGLRRFETVDRLSPPAQSAADIVQMGDLIRLQQQADSSWHLTQLPAAEAALVSLDAENGAILALVGGFNYSKSKFNRITQATRQPGSNFKPFIYTAALANGFSAGSIINDAPIVFEDSSLESTWRPTNDSGKFYGPTRLRQALYKSRNLVSIRLLRSMGIPEAINYVERFGFDPKQLPRDLSLALGSHSLTPLQIVSAYSALANDGYRVTPHLIQRIEDVDGETLFSTTPATVCRPCELPENEQASSEEVKELATIEDILNQTDAAKPRENALPQAERIIEPRVAYIMDSILRDVVQKGTGRRARVLERNDLAGKTGTTNGPTDAWFSGYGGRIATTAWLGFDKNNVLGRREYGGSAALPIWIDYMRIALAGRPETNPRQPAGLVTVKIDPTTGLLARPGQENAIFEIYREELAPKDEVESNMISDQTQIEEITTEDIF